MGLFFVMLVFAVSVLLGLFFNNCFLETGVVDAENFLIIDDY